MNTIFHLNTIHGAKFLGKFETKSSNDVDDNLVSPESKIFSNFTVIFSGFEYYATWNETFPELLLSGIGHLQIHLPEGQHKVKDWTIQLRYPHEMIDVESYQEKVIEMDCGGQGCPSQHYHVVPHFWDETKLNLGFELASKWAYDYIEIYPEIGDGPVPCVDWCENGEIPEYRGIGHTE